MRDEWEVCCNEGMEWAVCCNEGNEVGSVL